LQDRVDDPRNNIFRLAVHVAKQLGRISAEMKFVRGRHVPRKQEPPESHAMALRETDADVFEEDKIGGPKGKNEDESDRPPNHEFFRRRDA